MAGRTLAGALAALGVWAAAGHGAQRYATPPAAIAPVPMGSSCLPEASAAVDLGAAWLLVENAAQARAAFERAAAIDPDCALGYWGQALSRFEEARGGSAPAVAAVESAAARGASVPARTPFERAALGALGRLVAREAAPGVRAAWPARAAAYREALCEGAADRASRLWCARAIADTSAAPGANVLARALALLGDGPLETGAAVIALQLAPDANAPIVARALDAIAAANPPAPVPHALAARAAVRRGDWTRAVASAEAVRALEPDAVPVPVTEAHLEALFQLGRRAEAYALAGRIVAPPSGAAPAQIDAAARTLARVVLADRRLDGRGLADRAALPLAAAAADAWPAIFAGGLDAAIRAWPGGDAARIAAARAAIARLDASSDAGRRVEPAWARTLIEAAIAASQDEHPQMALLFAHASGLEAQAIASGEVSLPLVPARELAAELWLRTYRYDDARRDARAMLTALPRRISPYVVLARASARVDDAAAAADAWRTVRTLREKADADDSLRLEAERALAR
jgi:hypothetical protein